jgi:hypothetical protein
MSTPALAADYLFLAPLLQARLLDQVADVPVDVCETPDQVLAQDKRPRALLVLWAGDRVDEAAGGQARGGASQLLHQRWLVCLGLNNAGKAADARNTAAGPVLSQVHKALAGWTPEGCARPMRRANAPLRPTFAATKAVYPLGFEITLSL